MNYRPFLDLLFIEPPRRSSRDLNMIMRHDTTLLLAMSLDHQEVQFWDEREQSPRFEDMIKEMMQSILLCCNQATPLFQENRVRSIFEKIEPEKDALVSFISALKAAEPMKKVSPVPIVLGWKRIGEIQGKKRDRHGKTSWRSKLKHR